MYQSSRCCSRSALIRAIQPQRRWDLEHSQHVGLYTSRGICITNNSQHEQAQVESFVSERQKKASQAPSPSSLPHQRPNVPFRIIRYATGKALDNKEIPRIPQHWSASSLTKYVWDLTSSCSRHRSITIRLLLSVLRDDALRVYLTPEAFKPALKYMYKHSDFNAARLLFRRMQDLRMLSNTAAHASFLDDEVQEIMLWGSAQNKGYARIESFEKSLNNHLQFGGCTTPGMYLALLRSAPTDTHRLKVWRAMQGIGMHEDLYILGKATTLTIEDEFGSYIEKRQYFSAFFEDKDKEFGTAWLTPVTGNIILRIVTCSRQHGPTRSLEVLAYMQDRYNYQPDQATLHQMIFWPPRNVKDSETSSMITIKILRYFYQSLSIELGKEGYDALFERFYRRRAYNAIKVIWRAACLNSAASTKMLKVVRDSVEQRECTTPTYARYAYADTFRFRVGKVAVGAKPSVSNSEKEIGRALKSSRMFRMKESLPNLLERAVALDQQWVAEQVWMSKSVEWMIDNAIGVELVSKRKYLQCT